MAPRLCEIFHKRYILGVKMSQEPQHPVGRGFGVGYSIVGAGFQLAFSILFFLGMGYLADKWLGTKPLFLLIGLAIGLAAGFYAFWLRVKAAAGTGDRGQGTGKR